jgi:cytochrome c556
MKTLTKRIGKGMMTVIFMGFAALATAADDSTAQTIDEQRNSKEPLVLRSIMQTLSTDMQRITEGIATENWQQVAEVALNVADHPQPPMQERLRIIQFIGTDAGRFKSYDQQVHKAAKTLSEAAQREDGTAVIEAFSHIQNNCLGCHQNFRQPVQAHFYDKP